MILQQCLVFAVVTLKVVEASHPSHQRPVCSIHAHVRWVTLCQKMSICFVYIICTFSNSVCSTCCWMSNWSFSDSSSLLCLAISSCWLEEEALCAISWSQLARALFLSDVSLSCSCWRRERSPDHNSFSLVRDLRGGYCYAKYIICNVIIWCDIYAVCIMIN